MARYKTQIVDEVLDAIFPPKEGVLPAVEDVTMGVEPIGLGFPGERFDIPCPECKGVLRLRMSKRGLLYGCETFPTCKASHGAYPDGRPMGIPGDKATKKARILAHRIFDRLWKREEGRDPRMSRPQAYAWMQKALKLTSAEAHIGMFTIEQCNQLIEAVKKKYPGCMTAWDRLTLEQDPF